MAGEAETKPIKRKRSVDEGLSSSKVGPALKKTDTDVLRLPASDPQLKERLRKELKLVYSSYSSLITRTRSPPKPINCHAKGAGAAASLDGSSGAGAGSAQLAETAFLVLLEAGTGTCGAQRLAAHLIPRFLHRFPHHCEAAAAALLAILDPKQKVQYDVSTLSVAARQDALAGLSVALCVSRRQAELGIPAVLQIVTYAIRSLQLAWPPVPPCPQNTKAFRSIHCTAPRLLQSALSSPNPAASTVSASNGSGTGVGLTDVADGSGTVSTSVTGTSSELPVAQQLLECAYRLFPRVVLAICLQAMCASSADPQLQAGAIALFKQQLLTKRPASRANGSGTGAGSAPNTKLVGEAAEGASVKAAGGKGGSDRVALGDSIANGNSKGSEKATGDVKVGSGGGGASSVASSSLSLQTTLASEVLAQLPGTQLWVRQVGALLLKDKKTLASAEAQGIVEKLLKIVKALAGPATATTATAAAATDTVLHPPPPPLTAADTVVAPALPQLPPLPMPEPPLPPPMPPSPAAAPSRLEGKVEDESLPPLPPGDATERTAAQGMVAAAELPSAAAGAPAAVGDAAGRPFLDTAPPTALPARGGDVCRADACLWLGNLPPGLPEAAVAAECGRHSHVEGVMWPALGARDEVFVAFASIRDAAICFESLSDAKPWGGSRPLRVEFCSSMGVPADKARAGPAARPSQFVWLAGGHNTPEAVVRALQEAALPAPTQILCIQGRTPGFLLDMGASEVVPQTVACLQARLPPPVPHTAFTYAMPIPPQQHPAAASPSPVPVVPPGGAAPLSGTSPAADQIVAEQLQLRTLWVRQIADTISDAEVLATFRRHGEVVSYRFVRHHHAAFIDFSTTAGAAEARKNLNGSRLGPHNIQVDWKMDERRPISHVAGLLGSGRAPSLPSTPLPALNLTGGTPSGSPFTPPQTPATAAAAALGGPARLVERRMSGFAVLTHDWQRQVQQQQQQYGLQPGMGAQGYIGQAMRAPSLGYPTSVHTPAAEHLRFLSTPGDPRAVYGHAPAGGTAVAGAGAQVAVPDAPVPPPPPPPPLPPVPLAAAAPLGDTGSGGVWTVVLAKSGSTVCTLVCIDPVAAAGGGGGPREVAGWPDTLDVNLRAEVTLVQQTYHATASAARAVRRLVPAVGGEAALAGFLAYLSGKSRAGVIKLPAGGERGPRTLYLVPPTDAVCRSLGVPWEPRGLVLAVEVPTPVQTR